MQFPMRDQMTAQEATQNVNAQLILERGRYYRFSPPVTATAVPTGGPNTCPLADCLFDRGWYLGFVDGSHVFQGKPVNDIRVIPIPAGYEHAPDQSQILENLRESYFHILFIGGSTVQLDRDQTDL